MPYLGKQPVNVIKNNAVSTDNLVDDAVTNAKLAPNAINTTELVDNSVHTAKINASAVTDAKLNNDAVTTNKINNLAVTQGKLASEAVSEAKLHAGNAPTNNYVLSADSGQPGGLIWSQLSSLPGSGAWEEVAGGNFSSVTSITQSFDQNYLYRLLLFNLRTEGSTNLTITPAIQFYYGAGAGTVENPVVHYRRQIDGNSTTWVINNYNNVDRGALAHSMPVSQVGNTSNQTSTTFDVYITQPKVGTGTHIWKRVRYWSRAWGFWDGNSTSSYSRYTETQGAVHSSTGSYNDITSFKIIDNNLTSNTFSGTYRVLRIGAT
tara:strand:- start:19506 stop:20465 length:960 start_codon:yes stop_codon:yes gene_type:complete